VQQTRGEVPQGGDPAGVADRGHPGTAEPVTLVDLDGGVTRIAPNGSWTREQVRHPGDDPVFITRLERGQLWHRTGERSSSWTHEVQVGPATIVSDRGRFHVRAEPDGGATITCLEGQVAVATNLSEAMLLMPDEAVSVAADGETCIVVGPPMSGLAEPAMDDPAAGLADDPTEPVSNGADVSITDRFVASHPYVLATLLALVAILLVVLIVLVVGRGSGSHRSLLLGPLVAFLPRSRAAHS